MTASLTATQAFARLRRGDALHMELGDAGARLFWFERPHAVVSARVIDALCHGVTAKVQLVEARDSLFGLPLNSQTYLAARGGRH